MNSRDDHRARIVLGLLLLASFTVITLDARGGPASPVDPLRTAAANVFGPAETALADVLRPVKQIPGHFRAVDDLRQQNEQLQAANDELRAELHTSGLEQNRSEELDGLLRVGAQRGYDIVAAQVVALGPAQSFARTVTIDAGTRDGVQPDMTVVSDDGLVGRVLRADAFTSTVLLIVDARSVVGGRLGSSMELGFVAGQGDLSASGTLRMSLVDKDVSASPGDTVVTWGSQTHMPYVAGVPVGRVIRVQSRPLELSVTATIAPFVDFSSLDLVGVVVGSGDSDRGVALAGQTGPWMPNPSQRWAPVGYPPWRLSRDVPDAGQSR